MIEKDDWEFIEEEPPWGAMSELSTGKGSVWPEKGVVYAKGKVPMEHEKAHIDLEHAIFGEKPRQIPRLEKLEAEMDAYIYPLAKHKFSLMEFLDFSDCSHNTQNDNEVLKRQMLKSLQRLKRKNLISDSEFDSINAEISDIM